MERCSTKNNPGLSKLVSAFFILLSIYKFYLSIQKLSAFLQEEAEEQKKLDRKSKNMVKKTALCNGVKYFQKEHSYLHFHAFSQDIHVSYGNMRSKDKLLSNIKMFLHKKFHPIVLFSFAMIPKRGLTNNSYTGQAEAAGPSLKIYRNKCTCRYADLNIVVVCTCTTQ